VSVNVTLNNLTNLTNQTTAVNTINSNNAAITTGFTESLNNAGDRMLGTLDMNNNPIINLPAPVSSTSPVRLTDLTSNNVTVPNVTYNNIQSLPPFSVLGNLTSGTANATAITNGGNTDPFVVNGLGTNQSPNHNIFIGWHPSGLGLKATVDSTDEGYFVMSQTNPSQYGIPYANSTSWASDVSTTVQGATNQVLTGTSGSPPSWSNITSGMLDAGFGSTVGSTLVRTSGGWTTAVPTTAGQVLTYNGTTTSFGFVGPTLLNTVTFSGATTAQDTTSMTTTFNKYMVAFENITASANSVIVISYYIGGTLQSTGYGGSWFINNSASSTSYSSGAVATGGIGLNINTISNIAGYSLNGEMWFHNTNDANSFKTGRGTFSYLNSSSNFEIAQIYQAYTATGVGNLTGIKIGASTGTMSGTFKVYGIP
jgi:hypothetical protein